MSVFVVNNCSIGTPGVPWFMHGYSRAVRLTFMTLAVFLARVPAMFCAKFETNLVYTSTICVCINIIYLSRMYTQSLATRCSPEWCMVSCRPQKESPDICRIDTCRSVASWLPVDTQRGHCHCL